MRASLVAIAVLATGCSIQAFVCAGAGDCVDGGVAGSCEPNGFCSFPDAACPSGARFGDHAGDGLAGACVDDDGTTGDASGSEVTTATMTGTSAGPSTSVDSTSPASTDTPTDDGPVPFCGNATIEPGEQCDGHDIAASCEALGHSGGVLRCTDDCELDESTCTDCGNGEIERDEACDLLLPPAVTCKSLGFLYGEPVCSAACEIDSSGCNNCGNGVVDPGESCEDEMPLQLDCSDLGFAQGTVACSGCAFDLFGCGTPICGVDPTTSLTPCPPECSECVEDECRFDCIGSSECANDELVCPPGWTCRLVCDGSSSCANAQLTCNDVFGCSVSCNGSSSCTNFELVCGAYGRCNMLCESGTNACSGSTITCGGDDCVASCTPQTIDEEPDIECGDGLCSCVECEDQ